MNMLAPIQEYCPVSPSFLVPVLISTSTLYELCICFPNRSKTLTTFLVRNRYNPFNQPCMEYMINVKPLRNFLTSNTQCSLSYIYIKWRAPQWFSKGGMNHGLGKRYEYGLKEGVLSCKRGIVLQHTHNLQSHMTSHLDAEWVIVEREDFAS